MFITTDPGKERDVYTRLSKVPEIVDVHLLFGEFDLIARVAVEGYQAISRVVLDKIRSVPGVRDTVTMTEVPF